jgi:hypothetical protein
MADKKLTNKLLEASALINLKSTRGSGNYIIVNSTIASMLSILRQKMRIEKIKRIF